MDNFFPEEADGELDAAAADDGVENVVDIIETEGGKVSGEWIWMDEGATKRSKESKRTATNRRETKGRGEKIIDQRA